MSRYENYEIKNNVFGTLSAPISSLATTIQLGDGQGQRFSENMLATLENIENGKVMKREIVLITAINGDTLTVTRKYAPCPSNDEANTQGQVSYAFSTDDTISAYIDKEHFDELDKSINDIYDNGVNKLRTEVVSGLQIKVNAGPVLVGSSYYDFEGGNLTLTDNATNYIEIDEDGLLVSNTTARGNKHTKISKVTTSGGAVTNIEDWRLGTVGGEIGGVNIHDLTEKESVSPDDEFIIADSDNIYNNKKIKYNNIIRTIGDGSDGDLTITEPTQIEAKEYNFNNLTICSGGILAFCGNGVPVIRVKNCFCNEGKIDLMGDIQNNNGVYATLGGNVFHIKNVVGPTITITSNGGSGGYGCGGSGGDGGASGCAGCCGNGGNGGNAGICSGGGGGGGGTAGCNGGDCIGGDGGGTSRYYQAGGGGGYGYLKGGKGGDASGGYGGGGGDSYYCGGDGGVGQKSDGTAHTAGGGNGGFGYMCCGGNGGGAGCGAKGGKGGDSFWGKGGDGGSRIGSNGTGGDGGNSFFGNGGNGGTSGGNGGNGRNGGNGCCGNGGNAWGGRYGLLLVVNNGYNCCIDGSGGNGGNGSNCSGCCCGGNATDGAIIHILYKGCFTEGDISYNGGKGGTGCCKGTDGKDGELRIGKIIV